MKLTYPSATMGRMKHKIRPTKADFAKLTYPARSRRAAPAGSRILLRPRRANDTVTRQWGQIVDHIDAFMAEHSNRG